MNVDLVGGPTQINLSIVDGVVYHEDKVVGVVHMTSRTIQPRPMAGEVEKVALEIHYLPEGAEISVKEDEPPLIKYTDRKIDLT